MANQKRSRNCRENRRREAVERQEGWASLTMAEQLKGLALRPGKCAKQVARIFGV